MIAITSTYGISFGCTSDTADPIYDRNKAYYNNNYEDTVTHITHTDDDFIDDRSEVRITRNGIWIHRHAKPIKIIKESKDLDLIYQQKRLRSLVPCVLNIKPTKLVSLCKAIVKYRAKERGIGVRNFHKV
jgi:hypothetical protein